MINLGFKARGLKRLQDSGLTVLKHKCVPSSQIGSLSFQWVLWTTQYPQWGVRTDAPNATGELLPFFHYSKHNWRDTYYEMLELSILKPELSFIWSTALDHTQQVFNAVLWCDEHDVMRGEISVAPITLRQAWIKGDDLTMVEIDGGNADWFRNKKSVLPYIHPLRRVRLDLKGRIGSAYELTVFPYVTYFWEEIEVPSL